MYVIRGKSGYKLFSKKPETFGKEVKYETKKAAETVLKKFKDSLSFDEFEIIEV